MSELIRSRGSRGRRQGRKGFQRPSLPSRYGRTSQGTPPTIEGPGSINVGSRVVLAAGPVQSHLIIQWGAEIVLGDDVYVGYGAAISCHEQIVIGDGTRIGAFSAIMDTDFHVVGDTRTVPPPGPIRIDEGVRIGPNVVVLRGTHIGAGTVIEPNSVVWGDIPPRSHIVENPKSSASRLSNDRHR